MKPFTYSLLGALLVIFLFSIYSLTNGIFQYVTRNDNSLIIESNSIKGFHSTKESQMKDELLGKFKDAMDKIKEKTDNVELYRICINFFVTFMTGLATLLTTVASVRNNKELSKTTAIWIAVITFLSSTGSFGSSHFSEEFNKLNKRLQQISTLKTSFLVEDSVDKDNKAKESIINRYESLLQDI